jgi:hypothetical protein
MKKMQWDFQRKMKMRILDYLDFFFLLDYDFCFGLFEFMKLIFTFVTLLVTRAPYAFSFLFFR